MKDLAMVKSVNSGRHLSITEFKSKCLRFIAEAARKGTEITILKRGEPVAKVIPIKKKPGMIRGSLKGKATIHGDIVHFDTSDDWNVYKE